MKFDVVLGNPPFSKANDGKTSTRKKNLYPEFFELSMKCASKVAMIMPQSQKQLQPSHNMNLIKNCHDILFIDDDVFKIATSVWCVFYDENIKTRVEDFTKKNKMNSFDWVKGKVSSSSKNWESETGFDVIHSVRKDKLIILKKERFEEKAALPSHGFAIVLGITASSTFLIKCQRQMFGGNVYTLWFEHEEDAKQFKQVLDEKLKDIDHLRGNMGVVTIGGLQQIDFNLTEQENNNVEQNS